MTRIDTYNSFRECLICPRECRADRISGKKGVCGAGAEISVGSVCIHRGEEPPISGRNGICNIFFSHCNLSCVYCQNFQISRGDDRAVESKYDLKSIIKMILRHLKNGVPAVGFVSPSHFVPHIKSIITEIRSMGFDPVFVYNTNSYDKPGTIRNLEGFIDVYLPDFKYSSVEIAKKYSKADNYPETALNAIAEMHRQKGSSLPLNDSGYAESGIIVRHLVLPGEIDNSINALRLLSDRLGTSFHLSLMSQYYPPFEMPFENLNRKLYVSEYEKVAAEAEKLGFHKGWIQEPESSSNYFPDFNAGHPFER